MTVVRQRDDGFTLLEVLIAFAIAAPALTLLYRQGAVSSAITRTSLSYEEGVSRARSHLDAIRDAALVPGELSGDDGRFYHWRTLIVPLAALPPSAGPARATAYGAGTALFAVTVEISWPGGSTPRSVRLESRRLGPASGAPP